MELKDMTIEQLEERRTAIAAEIDAPEADLDALEEEARSIKEELETRKAAEAQRKNIRDFVANGGGEIRKTFEEEEPHTMTIDEIRSSHEYNVAYAEYLKTGVDAECRSLLTELVSGEVPVATYLEDGIQTAWKEANIASRARHVSVKGIIQIPFEYSATPAVVHTEGTAAPAEEELEIGNVTITPETLKKWITVSDTVTALKGEAFLDYIIAEIAQRITELEDKEAIRVIKAAVGATTKTQPGVASVTISAIDAYTIFDAMAKLADGARNPVAVMNKQTYFGTIMQLEDTTHRPIYNVVSENGKPTFYINGVPVLFNDNLTADTEILVGDFDGLVENVPDGGINFIRDPYSLAEKNLIKIVGRKMVGFGVTKENYFCLVTVS